MHRLLGFTTRTHIDPMHRNLCGRLRFEGREGALCRILPSLLASLTTALSIYLYANRDHVYTVGYVSFVRNERITAQVIVYICAYLLALMQIKSFQTILNYATRLSVGLEGLDMQQITLLSAIARGVVDSTLPFGLTFVTLAMATLLIAPGVLWTGSLTPTLYLGVQVPGSLTLPAFSSKSQTLWDFEYLQSSKDLYMINQCQHLKNARAVVSNCPVPDLQASLLLSGAGATTPSGMLRTHGKDASPEWTYHGRSFGVGSSIGLVDPFYTQSTHSLPSSYSYNETGYNVEVGCTKNSTTGISIKLQNASVPISTYTLTGNLPNEAFPSESYPILSFRSDSTDMCAWAARSSSGNNFVAIATGQGNYSYLNALACKVQFHPTLFNLTANRTSQSISVTPLSNNSALYNPDPTSRLIYNSMESLNLLSRMSNTLYVSSIGDSLQNNVMNMAARVNATRITEQIITSAAAEYFEAVLDDILLAYSTSQLLIANDTQPTLSLAGTTYGVKLGGWIYLLISLILNSLLVLVVLFEAMRTRLWRQLPCFNHADVRHCIIAASAGGAELATAVAAAKDSKVVVVGIKESNFVDGMVAVGVPRVNDVMLQDVTTTTRTVEGRKSGDKANLVVKSGAGPGSGDGRKLSRFSGGWVGVGGGIGTAK